MGGPSPLLIRGAFPKTIDGCNVIAHCQATQLWEVHSGTLKISTRYTSSYIVLLYRKILSGGKGPWGILHLPLLYKHKSDPCHIVQRQQAEQNQPDFARIWQKNRRFTNNLWRQVQEQSEAPWGLNLSVRKHHRSDRRRLWSLLVSIPWSEWKLWCF